MKEKNQSWVRVYKIFDDVAAEMIKGLLEDNGISSDVFYYQASSVLSLVQPSVGKGEIRVRKDAASKAKKIIADFEKQNEPEDKLEE
jgi:hypothetical protein